MGSFLNAIKGAIGLSNQGQSDDTNNTGVDRNKALQCTEDAWTDRKNSLIVYH